MVRGIRPENADVLDLDNIHALQRSEILDDRTCNFCLSMDGRTVPVGDEWTNVPAFHCKCRGIWVAILKDEVNLPAITGVPKELGDYYDAETDSLVQPAIPITKPGGLAECFTKKKAAAEKV